MAETAAEKIVKVTMQEGGFDQYQGKMRKGGVYEFPQEQAVRYVRSGVAKPAVASAKLARDEDREDRDRAMRVRMSSEALDAEMGAAWDVDVRDLERAEMEAEAAEAAAKDAAERVRRAERAGKAVAKAPTSPEPGPVNTEGTVRP
jgi:hypothetical protein